MTGLTGQRIRRALVGGAAVLAAVAGSVATAAAPASAATYQLGLDVSHYQGAVNWASVRAQGAQFAYMKATEGTTYRDPQFSANYTGSYNAGLIRGAYHFARPNVSSGAAQANYFAAHGGGWSADGKTLPPAVDLEAGCYGKSASSMVAWIRDFSNTIHAKYDKYPMIYTTASWWTSCTGNSSAFAATNPFWIAIWRSTPPTSLPAGTATWTMWQNADHGALPGDQDKFNGSLARLQALAKNHD